MSDHGLMIGFVICVISMYGLVTVRCARQVVAWLALFVIGMACGVAEAVYI